MEYVDTLGVESVGGAKTVWLPLRVHSALANTVEDISANIESALSRNLTPFQTLMGTKSGRVAIVGSGPSLHDTWEKLKNFPGDILACNASCQFLLGRGIVPTYMFCFDADPLMLEFITPHPEITYLIASRCPPKAFDLLEGCRIVCWHAAGDERIREILETSRRMEPMVVGGSAAVTRAMIVGISMGYTDIHIWGGDSSFKEGATHIRDSTTKERRMAIMCNGRVFETAPWMTQQAEDFKKLVPSFMQRTGVSFHVHGDGLIPHIARSLGCKTDYQNHAQWFVQTWRAKLKSFWAII